MSRLYTYNALGTLDWESETRETWGLFRELRLCAKCQEKGIGAGPLPVSVMRHSSSDSGKSYYQLVDWVYMPRLSEVRKAGFDGCAFCMVLYLGFCQLERAIYGHIYGPNFEPSGDWSFRYAFQNPRSVRIGAIHPTDGDGEQIEQFYINVVEDDLPTDHDRSIVPPDWVSFMRTRLDNCLSPQSNHTHCDREPDFPVNWPQRILRIAGQTAVLADFNPTEHAGQYAALSYCWGSEDELRRNPPLKTTASTWNRMRSGVDISDMPLTIRQALTICSRLDIEYIWVDALCIVQDDKADWEIEARKMATVYSLAKVTIIAASSTSCHSGFLDAVHLAGAPFELPAQIKWPPTMKLVARKTNTSTFHFDLKDFANFDPVSVAPTESLDAIDHRGWTFQEEYLATRYIKFTKEDIQWQCRDDAGCLCGQAVQKNERRAIYQDLWATASQVVSGSSKAHKTSAATVNRAFCEAGRACWETIVKDFSRRQFTSANDKLLALSGLVSRLAPNMQSPTVDSTYIAGMWKNMLLDGGALSWRCLESAQGRPPTNTIIAPSFSWASLDVGVVYDRGSVGEFGFNMEKPLFEVIDAENALLSADEVFGRVSGGSLTLSGLLIPCMVSSGPRANFGDRERRQGLSVVRERTWFDCGVSRMRLKSGEVTLQRARENHAFATTDAYVFVLMSMHIYGSFSGSGFDGLILGKTDGCPGCYQRLGYTRFTIETKSVFDRAESTLEGYKSAVTLF
ncbi:heterokaryon incompatibility protein-domain-containing protein [Immersiella caudata]|uniref:Heterokaryon incompatibility protein-domain-containing protein n=1 Tax=Immersiella caudata TaxID=314043 RepID=A0AA39XCD3_9PEZI|nr:heterokaryon incompatibility protein-domain-containing protein [Immersiella caudata]